MKVRNVFKFELAPGRSVVTIEPSALIANWSLLAEASGPFVVESLRLDDMELLAGPIVVGRAMDPLGDHVETRRDDSAGRRWDEDLAEWKNMAGDAIRAGDRQAILIAGLGVASMGQRPETVLHTIRRGAASPTGPGLPIFITISTDAAAMVLFSFCGDALEGQFSRIQYVLALSVQNAGRNP